LSLGFAPPGDGEICLGPLSIEMSYYCLHRHYVIYDYRATTRLIAESRLVSIVIKELIHGNTYCLTSGYNHIAKQIDMMKVLKL
jgi:hypothetical protein